jgi:tripartite-type tricarboxylate transporter receptor subunit TctC
VVGQIQAAVAAAVAEPDMRQQFEALGLEGIAMPPATFAAFVADQARIAQEIGRRVNGRAP